MSEPEFIQNTSQHAIAVPVGSRNAVRKSPVVGRPNTHDALAEDHAHATEPSSSGEDGTAVDTALPPLRTTTLADNQPADVAPLQAPEYVLAAMPDLTTQLSDELGARLAALKSENAAIAHQLDDLETLMGNQSLTKPTTQ